MAEPSPHPAAARAGRLRRLSSVLLGVPEAELRPQADLGDDLAVDSLAAIEWGMAIEDEFAVALPEDAWAGLRSYGDVEDLVARLAAAAP